jgi:hypothetical protein
MQGRRRLTKGIWQWRPRLTEVHITGETEANGIYFRRGGDKHGGIL